ncbi:MAG: AIM24 family protein, partial [Acidobacteriota bacterium]|nr:AIM24 family protein [Acidobacteriota bacterium]
GDGTALDCPSCGAGVDITAVVALSGWVKLPGRRDMAKLQFGRSFCQIEGTYVPVADMALAAGDQVYFEHHVLLWKDVQVQVGMMPLAGGWKRLLAGMPLIMTRAEGPGHIAFSRDAPGELIALPLQGGQTVDVREHLFMVASSQVEYTWFNTNIWYTVGSGKEQETLYPLGLMMDRFSAPSAPGLLLLHAAGNVFVRHLARGETILIKPTALLFKDTTVHMKLHFERPAGTFSLWGSWGQRYFWLRLHGPGRVAVQSVTAPVEGEHRVLQGTSSSTEKRW